MLNATIYFSSSLDNRERGRQTRFASLEFASQERGFERCFDGLCRTEPHRAPRETQPGKVAAVFRWPLLKEVELQSGRLARSKKELDGS